VGAKKFVDIGRLPLSPSIDSPASVTSQTEERVIQPPAVQKKVCFRWAGCWGAYLLHRAARKKIRFRKKRLPRSCPNGQHLRGA